MKYRLKHFAVISIILILYILCMVSCTKDEKPIADDAIGSMNPEKKEELCTRKAEALYKLNLVWGEMKYFHPAVVNSSVDWDEVLLEKLSYVFDTEAPDMDQFLIAFVRETGEFTKAAYDNVPDAKPYENTVDPLYFLEDGTFSPELNSILTDLAETNIENRKGSYADTTDLFPDFSREKGSKTRNYPSIEDTLVAFFRMWNVVNYYYPYKDGMTDMETLFYEYLDDFVLADSAEDYALAVLSFLAELRDSHVQVSLHVYDVFGKYQLPVDVATYGDSYIVTSIWKEYEKRTDLKAGDILVSINGKSVNDIISERGKYVSVSSAESGALSYGPVLLTVDDQDGNRVCVIRDGSELEVTSGATGNSRTEDDVRMKSGILEGNIGYIDVGSLRNPADLDKLMSEMKNTDGLIIDMRRYPGCSMMESFPSYFIHTDTLFSNYTAPDLQKPGSWQIREAIYKPVAVPYAYDKKVVVLTDEFTVSHGEFTVMLLSEAENVTVMGSTTNGTDGDIARLPLPGGFVIFTSVGIYDSDMNDTQRVGLVPDIQISLDPVALSEGRDIMIEKAIEYLD